MPTVADGRLMDVYSSSRYTVADGRLMDVYSYTVADGRLLQYSSRW